MNIIWIILGATLSTLSSAIEFTYPHNANLDFTVGQTVTVTWDFVDTDEPSLSLYLWNFSEYPPYYEPLEFNIPTSQGSATVNIPCAAKPQDGYQFNAILGSNVYIILAQSPAFSIVTPPNGSICVDATPFPTCPNPISTATVTVTVSRPSSITSAVAITTSMTSTNTAASIEPASSFVTPAASPSQSRSVGTNESSPAATTLAPDGGSQAVPASAITVGTKSGDGILATPLTPPTNSGDAAPESSSEMSYSALASDATVMPLSTTISPMTSTLAAADQCSRIFDQML